jgi:hypothetical protein
VQNAWQNIRWLYVAVLVTYLIVQVFAFRRLNGIRRMRSNTVLTVMVAVMFGSDAVRDVFFFENRFASQVGMA